MGFGSYPGLGTFSHVVKDALRRMEGGWEGDGCVRVYVQPQTGPELLASSSQEDLDMAWRGMTMLDLKKSCLATCGTDGK